MSFARWILPALALLPLCARSTPYDGKVFITGVVDADPVDESDPFLRNFTYKALEFFSEVEISPAEAPKFALRIYNDSQTASFNPATDVALAPAVTIPAYSRFYAVRDQLSFASLYDNAAVPDWKQNNGGVSALIAYEGAQLANFDGNEVYQLVYYPSGIGNLAGLTVLDTFGQVDYPGAPGGVPSFSYDNSYAYRLNGTAGTGTAFNPAHWILPGANAIQDFTLAATTGAVPFGTYAAVPEASTLALALVGVLGLKRRFFR